mgnify:CR=1 FL=1
MIKKTITYTDYNGVERTENFYFNLSKAEVMEMEMGAEGGMAAAIQKIVDAKDAPAIIRVFKDLVLKAYGVKSDDGRRFMKTKPDGSRYADDFKETEAYSQIFMELATDTDAASAFINGIVPADLAQQAANHPALQNA